MAYTRRSIRKRLLELNGWEADQVVAQTSGVIVVAVPASQPDLGDLEDRVFGQVREMGFEPIHLGSERADGQLRVRFCTQETVDERFTETELSQDDLEQFEAAGGVLRGTGMRRGEAARTDLSRRFESFLRDSVERFRVRLLHARADQVRELVLSGRWIDLATFNREIQSRGAGTALRGVAEDASLLDGQVPPERLTELESALESGELELHGNYLFDTWTAGFAVIDPALTDADREDAINRMCEILRAVDLAPIDRVARAVDEVHLVGVSTATVLGALLFPGVVPVSTPRVRELLRTLGYRFSRVSTFADTVRQIRDEVGADDYLQLHRFFEWYMRAPREPMDVKQRFEEQRRDPRFAFKVWVRRKRAAEMRTLIADPELPLQKFDTEIWRLRGRIDHRGEDVFPLLNATLDESSLPLERIRELREAIESGEIELHGNLTWGVGSMIYLPGKPPEERLQGLRAAQAILAREELTPLERARALMGVPGLGRNAATGLTMVFHPTEFAIFNEPSERALRELGYPVVDLESFQRSVQALREELGADDFLELDLFLWYQSQTDRPDGGPVQGGKPGQDVESPEGAGFDALLADLRSRGLYFSPELISNYLLALQSKRFVILTGISGTGKTEIARAVARHYRARVEVERPRAVMADAISVTVRPYMLDHHRLVLSAAVLGEIDLPEPDPETGAQFLRVRYPEGEAVLRISSAGGEGKALMFKGPFRAWFESSFAVGDPLFLRVRETTVGVRSIMEILAPATVSREEPLDNYRIVAVRPDWTDNRGLLGYFNPITERYVITEFLQLLLEAVDEERRAEEQDRKPQAFFVVLDEMNLARVEHYFSDFLSALESGEEIELHHSLPVESGEIGDGSAVPRRLRIPRNVFFTGTVNVDETTYMFSPKVLDRAFTIEFNEVDLRGFGINPMGSPPMPEDGVLRLSRLPETLEQLAKPTASDWAELGALLDGELRRVVVELSELLEGANRHFGYRVANEIGRYVHLAARQTAGDADSLWAALDLAILQKVLPKFHGTQQELESVLEELLAFAVTGSSVGRAELTTSDTWTVRRGMLAGRGADDSLPRLPRTGAKVWRMLDRLRKQGFTAYVE